MAPQGRLSNAFSVKELMVPHHSLITLTILVEAYDREYHDVDTEQHDPLTMLKYLMQESGMTQGDLGRLLGNRALASLILNGHRHLSKSHIRKLADHFKVSPALFFHVE